MKLICKVLLSSGTLALLLTSCNNSKKEFSGSENRVEAEVIADDVNRPIVAELRPQFDKAPTLEVFKLIQSKLTNETIKIGDIEVKDLKSQFEEVMPYLEYLSDTSPTFGDLMHEMGDSASKQISADDVKKLAEQMAKRNTPEFRDAIRNVVDNRLFEMKTDFSIEPANSYYPSFALKVGQERKDADFCSVSQAMSDFHLESGQEIAIGASCAGAFIAKMGLFTAEIGAMLGTGGAAIAAIVASETAQAPLNATLAACAIGATTKLASMVMGAANTAQCEDTTARPNEEAPIAPVPLAEKEKTKP